MGFVWKNKIEIVNNSYTFIDNLRCLQMKCAFVGEICCHKKYGSHHEYRIIVITNLFKLFQTFRRLFASRLQIKPRQFGPKLLLRLQKVGRKENGATYMERESEKKIEIVSYTCLCVHSLLAFSRSISKQ